MTNLDRRTARDRIRIATTTIALGGAVGVVGVAGGLAVHDQLSLTAATHGVKVTQPRASDDSPKPTQTHRHPSTGGGLSTGTGTSQAQSSGS